MKKLFAILSLVLALALLGSAVPAFADGETVPQETVPEITEPVLINGRPLNTYQINRIEYPDDTTGECVTARYVYITLPEMTREMPLVAELAFPGDMTTYGIRFTDESGTAHTYTVYISGRNGALMLTEE